MKLPNLFETATSELSQDAFIAWLLKWGDDRYKTENQHLHNCAIKFIQSLLGITDEIFSVDAGRQWGNIDVWAKINDKYFLIIEDKKGTKEHSNQLERYKDCIEKEFSKKGYHIIPVYYKMDEQSNFYAVKEAGYSIFSRIQMISVLDAYKETHDILSDYYLYLKNLDNSINAYATKPTDKWDWYAWRGFFSKLQSELDDGNWDYVPNASGGFLGFWWHWKNGNLPDTNFKFYLQLEYDKLIVKVECFEEENRNKIREYLRPLLYSSAQKLELQLNNYGRVGNYMGIMKFADDYRAKDKQNIIDMKQTLINLKKAELLINSVFEKIK